MTDDLHAVLAPLLAAAGLDLAEQDTTYKPDAGILRWEARAGDRLVIVEHWTRRPEPDRRWYVRVQNDGILIEFREGVTAERAVDACVLAGLLPAEQATGFRAGVRHAVRAQITGADL